jgi:hypothetical protein
MALIKNSILAAVLVLSSFASATSLIKVEGRVKQIQNGRAEIVAKDGVSRVELKKLPREIRDSLTKAVGKKKNVTIFVPASAMQKPKK